MSVGTAASPLLELGDEEFGRLVRTSVAEDGLVLGFSPSLGNLIQLRNRISAICPTERPTLWDSLLGVLEAVGFRCPLPKKRDSVASSLRLTVSREEKRMKKEFAKNRPARLNALIQNPLFTAQGETASTQREQGALLTSARSHHIQPTKQTADRKTAVLRHEVLLANFKRKALQAQADTQAKLAYEVQCERTRLEAKLENMEESCKRAAVLVATANKWKEAREADLRSQFEAEREALYTSMQVRNFHRKLKRYDEREALSLEQLESQQRYVNELEAKLREVREQLDAVVEFVSEHQEDQQQAIDDLVRSKRAYQQVKSKHHVNCRTMRTKLADASSVNTRSTVKKSDSGRTPLSDELRALIMNLLTEANMKPASLPKALDLFCNFANISLDQPISETVCRNISRERHYHTTAATGVLWANSPSPDSVGFAGDAASSLTTSFQSDSVTIVTQEHSTVRLPFPLQELANKTTESSVGVLDDHCTEIRKVMKEVGPSVPQETEKIRPESCAIHMADHAHDMRKRARILEARRLAQFKLDYGKDICECMPEEDRCAEVTKVAWAQVLKEFLAVVRAFAKTTASQPAVSAVAPPPEESAQAGAPAVSVPAPAPAVSSGAPAPAVSVPATTPAMSAGAGAPAVNVPAPAPAGAPTPSAGAGASTPSAGAGAPTTSARAGAPAVSVPAPAPAGAPTPSAGACAPTPSARVGAPTPSAGAGAPAVSVPATAPAGAPTPSAGAGAPTPSAGAGAPTPRGGAGAPTPSARAGAPAVSVPAPASAVSAGAGLERECAPATLQQLHVRISQTFVAPQRARSSLLEVQRQFMDTKSFEIKSATVILCTELGELAWTCLDAKEKEKREKLIFLATEYDFTPTYNYGERGMVGDCLYLSFAQANGDLPSVSLAELAKPPPVAFKHMNTRLRHLVANTVLDDTQRRILTTLGYSDGKREVERAEFIRRVQTPGEYGNDECIFVLSVMYERPLVMINADSREQNSPVAIYCPWGFTDRKGRLKFKLPQLYTWNSFVQWLSVLKSKNIQLPLFMKFSARVFKTWVKGSTMKHLYARTCSRKAQGVAVSRCISDEACRLPPPQRTRDKNGAPA
ncbi:hypothetical protein CYMTET_12951 [Cymbomonas tetramitiformis]|uniref:Uncharacterized protein n=1 Tax=Cymbomonas tetramitiformis TaxID=36881 RepID=A0AAE0GJH8_9CHLO|nr:hypothetical protein CYMTET_12951 [Cymbomonas tetramitiformis]